MTEPRIQYAKTKDGVSIAYAQLGEGAPWVSMPTMPFSHLTLGWELPFMRVSWERAAQKRMVVRYDTRGTGLSDREVTEYSLEALSLDLEAVVDTLNLEKFALHGLHEAGPVAIAYAARHPERVSHLFLLHSWARASTFWESPQMRAVGRAIDRDWEVYTETLAQAVFGWSGGEEAHQVAEFYRSCVKAETARAFYRAIRNIDVTDLLPQVQAPTLVMHSQDIPWRPLDAAKELAAGISGSRLAVLKGTMIEISDAAARAIWEFLGEGEEAPAELPEGMAVLLFADIAESTALTEQLGDAAFRAKARELDTSLRSVIRECAGTPVEGKVLGDGVLAVFTSARQAIDCALRCEAAGEPLGLQLHLGIHAGDVIREGNNVYGGAVNIAARIAAASAPGEVLVSQTVRDLARTSAGVTFDDRGQRKLKGVEGRQRLFAVGGGADG